MPVINLSQKAILLFKAFKVRQSRLQQRLENIVEAMDFNEARLLMQVAEIDKLPSGYSYELDATHLESFNVLLAHMDEVIEEDTGETDELLMVNKLDIMH